MIKLNIQEKKYKNDVIIKDMNLEVKEGEFLIIKGKSGSGKSTLMNIISLLDNTYTGKLEIDGVELSKASASKQADFRREHFGLVFQDYNLLPKLTVKENVIFSLDVIGYKGDKNKRADEILELVGLTGHGHKRLNQISGGQQQRIGIARSLAADPKYIIADEPTGNLDEETANEILELLQTLNKQGRTIIMITHDDSLLKYSTRAITIASGEIVEEENFGEVVNVDYVPKEKFKFKLGTMFKQAFKNFRRHIWTYVIIMVITIACSMVFALAQSGTTELKSQLKSLEVAENEVSIFIKSGDTTNEETGGNIPESELNKFIANPNIKNVEYYVSSPRMIKVDGTNMMVDYQNLKEGDPQTRTLQHSRYFESQMHYEAGRKNIQANEIVVNETFIKTYLDPTYDVKTGDASQFIGKEVKITYGYPNPDKLNGNGEFKDIPENYLMKEYTFVISGVDISSSKNVTSNVFLTSNQVLQINKDLKNTYPSLPDNSSVYSVDMITTPEYQPELEKTLTALKYKYEVRTAADATAQKDQVMGLIRLVTLFGAIIAAVIVGVINLKSIGQREKEIGIYYALGLSKIRITTILFFEMAIEMMIAIGISFALIKVGLFYVYNVKEIVMLPKIIYSPENYIALAVLIVLVSVLSLLLVVIKILRQDPIKILRKV